MLIAKIMFVIIGGLIALALLLMFMWWLASRYGDSD